MKRLRRGLAVLLAALLTGSLNACMLVVPWRLVLGDWKQGIPHDPLIFKNMPHPLARQAASGALIGLRERPFKLKDVQVVPGPGDSVLLMGSLPFEPPNPKPFEEDDEPFYQDAVLPVFVKVRWQVGSLTRFEVAARIIRTPFHSNWSEVYEATGSADATPAYLLRRFNDMRTAEEAKAMNAGLDRLGSALIEAVQADLPWVVEEVSR